MPITAPYGTWPSPITPAMLTEGAVGLSQVQVWSGRVWWNEARPSEAGRQVLVSADAAGGEPADAFGPTHSARTQVHEYGGRCATGHGDTVVWSDWSDQRLWRRDTGGAPRPLTAEPPAPRSLRYADPVIGPDGRWVVCVRERHTGAGVVNDLVAIPLDADLADPTVLASGRDFYAAPRLSPAGDALAWIEWDHPDMPWDHTELRVAPFTDGTTGAARTVAGDHGESITQPRWAPDGTLHYISDRSGWWNIYAEGRGPVSAMDAEFAGPDWVFGESSYTFLPDGRLVATWHGEGPGALGVMEDGGWRMLDLPYSSYDALAALDGAVVAVAGSSRDFPAVVRIGVDDGTVQVLRRSRSAGLDPAVFSVPQAITYPSGGEVAHAWYYPPTNPAVTAPSGEAPPLVVVSHGGPTAAAAPVLSLSVQYWTSRGFAVADVDYRGSTGYGRAYRESLRGAWGVKDVEDCSTVVAHLASQGLADPGRAVIRGGSAGGFTTLAALAFTDVFAAGASHFGVADLELLARDTHKFESRYLDRLVGAWPEDAAVYRARSPIHHLDGLRCPVILFQGSEDAVVPQAQADLIHAALRDRGVPVAYLLFEGEQHGFRQASTIEAVAEAELAFYGRVLDFSPAGAPTVPPIDNEEGLRPAQ